MAEIKAEIPTIDIEPWLKGSDPESVVSEVRSACMTYGFFQLTGHGISLDLQHKAFECSKRFFSLPLEQKLRLTKDPLSGRGYEAIGSQALQAGDTPDQKEAMRIGRDVQPDDPNYGTYLYGSNRWPNLTDDEFKIPIMEYRQHMLRLATEVMKILAKGLPYDDHVFNDFMEDPVASVKLLHYPPQPSADKLQLGAGAHTDFGAITLLLQHPGQEGLEVLHPALDAWIPVPTVENTFVVNIGDVLSAWTNKQYRSALHRVINKGMSDRYSIPFFYDGTMSTEMNALDGSKTEHKKTVGEHFKARFSTADLKA